MSEKTDQSLLRVDEHGHVFALGVDLKDRLSGSPGLYLLKDADLDHLHFERVKNFKREIKHEEFRKRIILQGDLAAMHSPVDVINLVASGRMSGSLVFSRRSLRKLLHFHQGEVRGASSNEASDRLGEVLFRFGGLNRAELEQASHEARLARRPLGNWLIEREYFNQEDLYRFVRHQVEEIFYSILMWQEGNFYLTELDPASVPSPLALNTQMLLMEGLQRVDELAYFREDLPHEFIKVVRSQKQPTQAFTDAQIKVMSLLSSPRTIESLIQSTKIGGFETLKTLHILFRQGFVEINGSALPEPEEEVVLSGEIREFHEIVGRFNRVFAEIHLKTAPNGHGDALANGLSTFLQYYGFTDLFDNVGFTERGQLDTQQLFLNLNKNNNEDRCIFLSKALSELLFFEMFAARAWLNPQEQQALQQLANDLGIEDY
ncbi:DUF4388 domain-containing protein [Myxococcota bacterium]|nr:DUF4388 domain-containing protein [Myxococcota bacterium]MBU1429044.1 DUF4388 domain-containing protein [Myxococcota bacterium]MBU1897746.1 DUF4388 domain-containing protein [Myxococcota bacterium]